MKADIDQRIDEFVAAVNRGRRDKGWADEIPASVATAGPDDYGDFDWQIRRTSSPPWIAEIEKRLPAPFPRSYRSLMTRYIFPAFEIPGAFLFANTPEGSSFYELRRRLQDPIAQEIMSARGLVQFGNASQYNYDPICFDTTVGARDREFPIVQVDHEDVLCVRGTWRISRIAESFLELIGELPRQEGGA